MGRRCTHTGEEIRMEVILAVALGGAIGAVLRVLVADILADRPPRATLFVNIVGSFAAGVALGSLSGVLLILVTVGLCGALTTFSTFANEVTTLARAGNYTAAGVYALMTAIACVGAVGIGLGLA